MTGWHAVGHGRGYGDPTLGRRHRGGPAKTDFFVSYTAADQQSAEWIAWQLEAAGYRVLIQAWDSIPGSIWAFRIQQGVTEAARTIAALSEAYLTSDRVQAEWRAVHAADPLGFASRLIPVKITNCPLPDPHPLRQIVSLDLFGLDEPAATTRLTKKINSLRKSREKPSKAPPFPKPPWPGPVPPVDPSHSGRSTIVIRAWRGVWHWVRAHPRRTLAVVVVVVVVVTTWPPWPGGDPDPAPPSGPKIAAIGQCDSVSIMTGQPDSPYNKYGEALAGLLRTAYPGTKVNVVTTIGSAHNLNTLRDPNARCSLSIVQLTTAVDARYAVSQFAGSPIDELRSVGPLWFDLLQLVVRQGSDITTADQLCSGTRVATGLPDSGTFQIGQVLFRQIQLAAGPQPSACSLTPATPEPMTLVNGLAALRAGHVDAVLWSGGAPTDEIYREATEGVGLRLLPLASYQRAMETEWDNFYRSKAGNSFARGQIYGNQTIGPQDYPGIEPASTVAIPNGIVATEATDPDLVRYTAQALTNQRAVFERALWPDDAGRHFLTSRQTVGTNPAYCLVPLHLEAKKYYESVKIYQGCPAS
ncbi:TAXI family TRAP transporter solute-binding subunit [Frankia sp. CcWB2]